jgi:2-polyprenyl-6-methoxyphenol hydroxylase-like FAD-dependent oxidoreductase
MGEPSGNGPVVLVVGAGPTGLVMASQLARHGVPVRVLEKNPGPSNISKALAVQARTLEVFDDMGIVEEAMDRGIRVRAANVYSNGHRLAHLGLASVDSSYNFALDLAQNETEMILGGYLKSFGVPIEWQVELLGFTQAADAVTATLKHADGREETVVTPWLVGCDGAHSTVRHTLGLPFEGAPYPEGWALLEAKIHWDLPADEWHLFIQPEGVFVVFPLRNGNWRMMADAEPYAGDGPLPQPTLEEFQRYIKERALPDATISDPVWMSPFRIHMRRAPHFRRRRAFLAGDAVHIHSPAGGQGMNTGIQDAYNLAWKLALVQAGHAPDSLLDSYEVEREPVAESVMHMSDLMIRLGTVRNPLMATIRNRLYPIAAEIPALARRLADRISELNINYRKSPIVAEDYGGGFGSVLSSGGPHPGDRAPDASPLADTDGDTLRLFDVLRSTKHTLLLFAGVEQEADTWKRLDIVAEQVRERYGTQIQVYQVAPGNTRQIGQGASTELLLDPELVLHHRFGAHAECLYLVRPDGYVGFRSQPANGASLQDYLGRIFS